MSETPGSLTQTAEAQSDNPARWQPYWRVPPLMLAAVLSLLAALYWLFIASDRYVSEAHIYVQRTDLPGGQHMDFSGALAGILGNGTHTDQLVLRDYLLSTDMLDILESRLKLREHYSDPSRDLLSRLWRSEKEWFYRHYLSRVSVHYDDRSGILQVSAQAYDPQTARAIIRVLVEEGERFMNAQAHALAEEQVRFLDAHVAKIKDQLFKARQAVIAFQARHGQISPQATAEQLVSTLAQFEAKRIELEAQRNALKAYLVPNHPSLVQIEQQLAALKKQIESERAKLTKPSNNPLNRVVEEYQRLEFDAAFAQEMYQAALAALERGRVEAARTIKKVAVLQNPTLPEYPERPRRYYNSLAFALLAFLLAGLAHLVAAIIREHKD